MALTQGFDAKAYADFQALFDVPAGRAAPYILPPKRAGASEPASPVEHWPRHSSRAELAAEEGVLSPSSDKASSAQVLTSDERLLSPLRKEAASLRSHSSASTKAYTAGGASSEPTQSAAEAPDSAADARTEQAGIEAAVQKEIARQVREFLQSAAGRETLLRELQGIQGLPPLV